jgi:hypothetical protein
VSAPSRRKWVVGALVVGAIVNLAYLANLYAESALSRNESRPLYERLAQLTDLSTIVFPNAVSVPISVIAVRGMTASDASAHWIGGVMAILLSIPAYWLAGRWCGAMAARTPPGQRLVLAAKITGVVLLYAGISMVTYGGMVYWLLIEFSRPWF